MTRAEIDAIVGLLEAELAGLGAFGRVELRLDVRAGLLHRAEASRTRSVMLAETHATSAGTGGPAKKCAAEGAHNERH